MFVAIWFMLIPYFEMNEYKMCLFYHNSHFLEFSECNVSSKLVFSDHLLRGQKLPGSVPRVWQWLQWPAHLLPPLQLHQSGGRILGSLWKTRLHGLPVRAKPRRVSRLPVLARYQRFHQVLSNYSKCRWLYMSVNGV